MKVLTVVGARPQFIKAASVSRALRGAGHEEVLVHTGQHYDDNMSAVFFDELEIPEPYYNLGVGSARHGLQTATMLAGLEEVVLSQTPDWVLVYGDTNSTLAGALCAAKLCINLAHIEAGLRSYNRRMPEEINRVITDYISDLLLCPSTTSTQNLAVEGITKGVCLVGDVMADALQFALERSEARSRVLQRLGIAPGEYLLITVHRAENTDDENRLTSILQALVQIDEKVIFPVHPRTRKLISELFKRFGTKWSPSNVAFIEPLGYLDMVMLEKSARMILTDSGGIQKEAYWLQVPCVTLRQETEWVETVIAGWNVLVSTDCQRIVKTVREFVRPKDHPALYHGFDAASRCVASIEQCLS